MQWINDPEKAVAEFRRVTKPGGVVVCCNFDGFAITHYPEDESLQRYILTAPTRADCVREMFSHIIQQNGRGGVTSAGALPPKIPLFS
jgi:ubiquinone/menaquinone biosynthesis C-methylase UbiE